MIILTTNRILTRQQQLGRLHNWAGSQFEVVKAHKDFLGKRVLAILEIEDQDSPDLITTAKRYLLANRLKPTTETGYDPHSTVAKELMFALRNDRHLAFAASQAPGEINLAACDPIWAARYLKTFRAHFHLYIKSTSYATVGAFLSFKGMKKYAKLGAKLKRILNEKFPNVDFSKEQ